MYREMSKFKFLQM